MPPLDLIGSTADVIGRIERAAEQLAAIPDEINGQLFAIRADDRLSDEGRQAEVRELRQRETGRVGEIRRQVADLIDRASKLVARDLRAYSGGTNEQLLAEQRESRAWDRAVRQLDAGSSPRSIIDQAHADGDAVALRALRTELLPWLRAATARVVKGGDRIGGEGITDAMFDNGVGLMAAIDDALIDLLPASETEPVRNRRRLEDAIEDARLEGDRAMLAAAGTTSPTQRFAYGFARNDLDRRRAARA